MNFPNCVASACGVDSNAHVARLQGCNRHILRCGAVQVVAYCTTGSKAVAGDLPRRCSLRCLCLEDHGRHERCTHRRGEVDAQVLVPWTHARCPGRTVPARGWEELGRSPRYGRDRRCRCLRCGVGVGVPVHRVAGQHAGLVGDVELAATRRA